MKQVKDNNSNVSLIGSEKNLSLKNISKITQSVYWVFHHPPRKFSTLLSCGAICNLDSDLLCSISEWMEVGSRELDERKVHG
jgi:hypothetical protein